MKRRSVIAVFLVVIAVSAGVCVRTLLSPVFGDDIGYSYKITGDENATSFVSDPLLNVGDLVDSQVCHYLTTNGRAVVHTLVQCFDAFAGRGWFAFFNALIFGLTIILMCIFTWGWQRITPLMVTCAAFTILFCMPECASLWYLPALSINYLWSICATLVFLLIWQRRGRLRPWCCIALFPLMFLLGWSHEAATLPVSGVMLIYYFKHPSEFRRPTVLLPLAYGLGALGLLLSPGNFNRAEQLALEYHGIISWVANHLLEISKVVYLDIVAIGLAIVYLFNRPAFHKIIIRSWLPLSIGGMATFFLLLLCRGSGRAGTMADFFMLVVILQIAEPFIRRFSTPTVTTLAIVFTLGLQWLVIREMSSVYDNYKQMVNDYLASPDGTICSRTTPMHITCISPWVADWDMDLDPEKEYYEMVRHSYGGYFHHPTNAPISVVDSNEYAVLSAPDLFFTHANLVPGTAGVYHIQGFRHMIKPLAYDENVAGTKFTVTFDLTDNTNLSLRKRIRQRLYGLPGSDTLPSTIVTKNGRRFLILNYPTDGLRITSVDRSTINT